MVLEELPRLQAVIDRMRGCGATMLLVYFALRGELIGILGQFGGWLIYGRNLYFVRVKHKRVMSDE